MLPAVRRPRRLHRRTYGRHVETGSEIQRDLRLLGAADPARRVHNGPDHLLEVPEDQRPHIQHHVEEGREERRKVRGLVGEEREEELWRAVAMKRRIKERCRTKRCFEDV